MATMGKLVKAYLALYNAAQTAGWSYLLYQLISYYANVDSSRSLWHSVWWTVMIFQNGALFEVLHAALGLVQSSVMVTLMQVYSRVFLVCGILAVTKTGSLGLGLPLALLAWCLTEIIRYGYYFCNLFGAVPKILVFLRYTLFIILYPIGITGELLCMYKAQSEVGMTGQWSMSMPNRFNFIFNYQYFIIFYMLLYIPFFPMLYGHMFAQRKKILGGAPSKKAKTK